MTVQPQQTLSQERKTDTLIFPGLKMKTLPKDGFRLSMQTEV